jgi:hypothetical protein
MNRFFFYATLVLFCLLASHADFAQAATNPEFPKSWLGKWSGTLDWYQGPVKRQSVKMELHILATDSADQFSWRLIYGQQGKDNRPYLLKPFNKSKGHWLIDEGNSIVLDQFLIGDRFCGSFTVEGNTILNTYSLAGDSLVVEFYNFQEKPIAISGGRDSPLPKVKTYGMRSFQRAVLRH